MPTVNVNIPTPPAGEVIIDIARAALQALIAGSTVGINKWYRITDATPAPIIVRGVAADEISTEAQLEGTFDGSTTTYGGFGTYDIASNDFKGTIYNNLNSFVYNGVDPSVNTIGSACGGIIYDVDCVGNSLGDYCSAIKYSRGCVGNINGNNSANIYYGLSCSNNQNGNNANLIVYLNYAFANVNGNGANSLTYGNYVQNFVLGDNFQYCTIAQGLNGNKADESGPIDFITNATLIYNRNSPWEIIDIDRTAELIYVRFTYGDGSDPEEGWYNPATDVFTPTTVQVSNRVVNSQSMGVIEGGELSINLGDNTKFDISDGNGLIIDNWTDPDNPVLYPVSWSGLTALTVTNLGTATTTFVLIDNTGSVVQQTTQPTDEERRDMIYLGQLSHTNLTTVNNVINTPDFLVSPISQIRDLEQAVGPINQGNVISANGANLSLNKSSGSVYFSGANFFTNAKIPSVVTTNSLTAPTLRFRTQTGNGNANSTSLDVGYYDVAGTVTALSGTKYTNQRVYLVPTTNNLVVQYGQAQYTSIDNAVNSLPFESFVVFPNLAANAILIGIICVRSTATDLTDTTQARFIPVSKFGEAIASVGGNSSGSGTVNSGTANRLTYYAATGTAVSELAAITASRALKSDSNGLPVAFDTTTEPSLTELSYVKGVTSSIQTQLNSIPTSVVVPDTFVRNGQNQTFGASTTRYVAVIGVSGNTLTAISQAAQKITRGGVIPSVGFTLGSTQPATGSLVITLMRGATIASVADTAAVITIPANSVAGEYTYTGNVTVNDGDYLVWKIVNNATGASGQDFGSWFILNRTLTLV